MRDARRWIDREDEEAGANRQTASLAGLAVTLLIVVVCLLLVRVLHREALTEDCLMSGRVTCSEILQSGAI